MHNEHPSSSLVQVHRTGKWGEDYIGYTDCELSSLGAAHRECHAQLRFSPRKERREDLRVSSPREF
jgi:hypothetical protein